MTDMSPPSKAAFYNKTQLALHFGVSPRTVDDWKLYGIIPYLKVGRVIRYRVDAVEAALARFTVNAGGAR